MDGAVRFWARMGYGGNGWPVGPGLVASWATAQQGGIFSLCLFSIFVLFAFVLFIFLISLFCFLLFLIILVLIKYQSGT